MSNISLYTVTSFLILDNEGKRLYAKYYQTETHHPELSTFNQQVEFEKKVFTKINKLNEDILLFSNHLIVYKQVNDVLLVLVANLDENEALIYQLLSNILESFNILLKSTVDKLTILDKYDLVTLSIDEAIDDGIILEIDPVILVSRVTDSPKATGLPQELNNLELSEKGLFGALSFASKKIGERLQGL